MKKFIILILLILCLIPKNIYSNNIYANFDKETIQQDLYKGSLLSLLDPYISSAVNIYYGYTKQYDLYDAKIIGIKKIPEELKYEITILVETFTGAHNPPRGFETITILTSPMETKVINFNHKPE